MKRKITLLMLAAGSMFQLNAQVLFQEDFTSPFNTAGWSIQNLSAVANPTLAWFQGNGANVFPAFNGGPDDYYGCNYNNTQSSSPATISSWLITPTLNLANGNVVEFATRTETNPANFPDRLEVYMSTAGAGTNVGNGPTTVGTFSTLLVSVNPNLTTTGYPGTWTIYTATITGLGSPTLGRIGFRYHVTNGGPSPQAANSNYVGIDAFRYYVACDQPTVSITASSNTICQGGSSNLTAVVSGTVPAVSYTWSNGSNAVSTNVTPSVSTIYTVSASSASGCVGTSTINIVVTPTPTLVVPSVTICPSTPITLNASGAATYSWSSGGTSASENVTSNATLGTTDVYTVTGYAQGGICSSTQTVGVTSDNFLSINITASSQSVCVGRTVTLTATSASQGYLWGTSPGTSPLGTSASITQTVNATTTYTVGGAVGNCVGSQSITITALANPTLSFSSNPATGCPSSQMSFTGSGASAYIWVLGQQQTTLNPVTVNTAANPAGGTFTLGLIGIGANGCAVGGIVNAVVAPTPTVFTAITKTTECTGKTVTVSVTGADTYTWSGSNTSNSSSFSYSNATAGSYTFNVVGTSTAGCISDTASVVLAVTTCTTVGIEKLDGNNEASVFPNPFVNQINVSGIAGTVEIYNTLGQVVIKTDVKENDTINTSNLPKGAYILKAHNANGEVVKMVKLLKN